MELFKKIIQIAESYDYERCSKFDGLEKDICNWVFNELRLHWDKSEIDEARSLYGDVDVGTVYRGVRIETEEQLEQLKAVENGGELDLDHLVSSSKFYDEAKSFALYLKSYDEMTLFYGLKAAYARGSAGEFGGAVITFKPNPKNVIVKTYSEGNEEAQNPQWRKPESGAEAEVILYGKVQVEKVKFFPKVEKDNWKQWLHDNVHSVSDLDNHFVRDWFNHHKINYDDVNKEGVEILDKILKNDDDIYEFLAERDSLFHSWVIFDHLKKVQDFIAKYGVVNEKGWVSIKYKDHRELHPSSDNMIQHIIKKNGVLAQRVIKNLLDKMPNYTIKLNLDKNSFWNVVDVKTDVEEKDPDGPFAVVDGILSLVKHLGSARLKKVVLKHPKIQAMIKQIQEMFHEVLEMDYRDIVKHARGFEYIFTRWAFDLLPYCPDGAELGKELFKKIYYLVPHGHIDDDKREGIRFMEKMFNYNSTPQLLKIKSYFD